MPTTFASTVHTLQLRSVQSRLTQLTCAAPTSYNKYTLFVAIVATSCIYIVFIDARWHFIHCYTYIQTYLYTVNASTISHCPLYSILLRVQSDYLLLLPLLLHLTFEFIIVSVFYFCSFSCCHRLCHYCVYKANCKR